MGGSFWALGKKERHRQRAETEEALPEATKEQGLAGGDTDGPKKQPRLEIMYVTSV